MTIILIAAIAIMLILFVYNRIRTAAQVDTILVNTVVRMLIAERARNDDLYNQRSDCENFFIVWVDVCDKIEMHHQIKPTKLSLAAWGAALAIAKLHRNALQAMRKAR